ncbi:hypothetical protein [Actinomadura formosensis]|uniref:hypothetical protein n=1 Tax=Actinomadura formosensis TaxID=60706 RepID=UPI0010412BC7|nr:hypothetical protein [Actinomadura formosensis]
MTADDLRVWVRGLFARMAGRFGRAKPRRQTRAYLTGLLAPVEHDDLRSSLTWDPGISLAALRRRADIAPLDLGALAVP